MATIQEQIAQAKSAGYSDDDIAKHLSSMQDFAPKIKQAQAAGYSASDIVSHLSGQAAPSKSVGEKMNDAIGSTSLGEIGRQLGLTARYGLQGVGDVLDTLSSPIRAGLNMAGMNIQGRSGEGLADSLGLPKPQGTLENTIGKASELMAGGAIPIGLASKAAQGTQGVTQAVLKQVAANPLAQTVSNAGAGAAGEYVKQEGGNEKAQLLATLGGGLLAPVALAGGQKAVSAAQKMMTPKADQQQAIDLTIKNIIDNGDYGVKFADVSGNVKAQLRKDLGDALANDGQLAPDAARRLVDYRLVGATPTKGTLTLDPIQITREKNLAKVGANSGDQTLQVLANTQNQNNSTLIRNLNDLGAGTSDTAFDAGNKIISALDATDAKWRQAIGQRYDAARATNGRSAMIDPSAFAQSANNALDDALLGGKLPADVRNLMNKIALGPDVEGGIPLTVDVAEQFKTRIGDLQRATNDRAEKMALGLVRQSLDQAPLLPGQDMGQKSIDAFNAARRLNRTYMDAVKQNPALQAVREGVEPDKFVQNFIIGNGGKSNVSDVMALRSAVAKDPNAVDAIRGQITSYLKSQALNSAADEVGNFSSSNYNKALKNIGDNKLKMFFAPDEIAQLKSVGRVASYEQYQPKGSAVNNSNSGALALAGALDFIANNKILSRIPMGDSLLRTPARNFATQIQMKQATDIPRGLLVAPPAGQRPVPYGLLTAPVILNTTSQQ